MNIKEDTAIEAWLEWRYWVDKGVDDFTINISGKDNVYRFKEILDNHGHAYKLEDMVFYLK